MIFDQKAITIRDITNILTKEVKKLIETARSTHSTTSLDYHIIGIFSAIIVLLKRLNSIFLNEGKN